MKRKQHLLAVTKVSPRWETANANQFNWKRRALSKNVLDIRFLAIRIVKAANSTKSWRTKVEIQVNNDIVETGENFSSNIEATEEESADKRKTITRDSWRKWFADNNGEKIHFAHSSVLKKMFEMVVQKTDFVCSGEFSQTRHIGEGRKAYQRWTRARPWRIFNYCFMEKVHFGVTPGARGGSLWGVLELSRTSGVLLLLLLHYDLLNRPQ